MLIGLLYIGLGLGYITAAQVQLLKCGELATKYKSAPRKNLRVHPRSTSTLLFQLP